jgi:hypothetical protein
MKMRNESFEPGRGVSGILREKDQARHDGVKIALSELDEGYLRRELGLHVDLSQEINDVEASISGSIPSRR